MKNYPKSLTVVALSFAALAFAGCNDRDKDVAGRDATLPPAPATIPANPDPTMRDRVNTAAAETREASRDAWDKTKEVSRDAWDKTKETAGNAADSMRNATSDGWESFKDATYDERATVRSRVDAAAMKLDAKVADMSARNSSLSGKAREEWNESMEDLREARADLKDELNEFGDATADGWAEAKRELGQAWDKVQMSYARLEAKMRGSV